MPSTSPEEIEDAQKAVLFARLESIDKAPHCLSSPIAVAASKTVQTLRIVLVSPLFDLENAHYRSAAIGTKRWDAVQSTLTYVYVQAMKVAQEMGRILMDVDVLLKGEHESLPSDITADAEIIYRSDDDHSCSPVVHHPATCRMVWLPLGEDPAADSPVPALLTYDLDSSPPLLFPVVASGGTFDHLHAGHKILLSMAAWIAKNKLIVGITDDSLLKNKAHKEVMQSLSERIAITRQFLELFKSSLEYDIVAITDVAGPTGWDPNVQALVVSKETLNGAAAIKDIREKKGLLPLKTFVIDVISHTEASLDAEDAETLRKTKMSSTFIREWIVRQGKLV
ncbi:Nucleotidylyl transferase [Cytidiella melzeri]|nr:Nucleotidylyl transferase [Cytidiella melzeri]